MRYMRSGSSFGGGLSGKAKTIIIIAVVAVLLIVSAITAVVLVNKHKKDTTVERIYVTVNPTKINYYVGERADYSGLKIDLVMQSGKLVTVEYNEQTKSEFSFSGFNSSAVAERLAVTVYYAGFNTSFSITVQEEPKPTPELSSITIQTMPKTEYLKGEWLDTNGGVLLRHYTDGSTSPIALINNYVYGWSDAYYGEPGEYVLTVKYIENGTLVQTTYTITISAPNEGE